MKLAIGSDKSGYALKTAIANYLTENGIEFTDLGITLDAPKPYVETAKKFGEGFKHGEFDKGILICGTGMGMAIIANKFEGIYAACCESVYAAKMARAINNANVLTMGGWIIGPEMGVAMAKAFLSTEWLEDLEDWRKEFLTNSSKTFKQVEKDSFDGKFDK